jgi:hypothetical protein
LKLIRVYKYVIIILILDDNIFVPTAPPRRKEAQPTQQRTSQSTINNSPQFQSRRPSLRTTIASARPPTINPNLIKITVKSKATPPQSLKSTNQPRFISPRPRFDPRGGNRASNRKQTKVIYYKLCYMFNIVFKSTKNYVM